MSETFDYIVVGSGPGGSVVANRLSKDKNTSVCLIEAGGPNTGSTISTPMLLIANVSRKTKANWAFDSAPQKGLNGRTSYQPRGKGLGGSSSINALVYMRGHRKDYDEWAENGCPGWSYDEVLPYFKKSEHNEVSNNEFHGQGGEMNVAALRTDNPYLEKFKNVCRESGLKETPDFNGANQEGFSESQVMQKDGARCSSADAFIRPIMEERDNLTVHLNTKVVRVLFDGKKAIGVEVSHKGVKRNIMINKEIILSAGAFQTPQILQLSGVGKAKDLTDLGIDVVHDLPQVGENLHDHPDFVMAYKKPDANGLIGFSPKGLWGLFKQWRLYRKEKRGMFTTNYAEINGFHRITPDSERSEIQYMFIIAPVVNHGRTTVLQHGFSCHVLCLRPTSRGYVKLASANFEDDPLFDLALLEDKEDIDCMVTAAKKFSKVIAESSDLGNKVSTNMFDGDHKSDADWEQAIRSRSDTNYHPVGSCRMGTDGDAVVDSNTMKVNGLENLRISDASVMPTIPGGNTTAPTMMIAEKCADFILNS